MEYNGESSGVHGVLSKLEGYHYAAENSEIAEPKGEKSKCIVLNNVLC